MIMSRLICQLKIWKYCFPPISSSVMIFFSLLLLINTVRPRFYPTINRVTTPLPMEIYVLNPHLDTTILVIVSVLTAAMIAIQYVRDWRLRILVVLGVTTSPIIHYLIPLITAYILIMIQIVSGEWGLIKNSLLGVVLIATIVEALALIGWLTLPLNPETYDTLENPYPWMESKLFHILSPLQPLIASILVISPILYLIIAYFKLPLPKFQNLPKTRISTYLLIASVVLSILLAYYPYIPSMNPTGRPVGVDILWGRAYATNLERMLSVSSREVLGEMFTIFPIRETPLIFLVMYVVAVAMRLPALTVAKMFPLVLAPCYVLSIYFTTRILVRDDLTAGLSSLIAAVSRFFTVAMFSGYLANWLAIICILPSIALLISGVGEGSYRKALYSSILSIAALLAHPYTWIVYFTAAIIYMVLARRSLKIFTLWMSVNLAIVLTGVYMLGSMMGVERLISSSLHSLNIRNLADFWSINTYLFRYYNAGYQTIPLLYILAVIGILSIRGLQGGFFKTLLAICTPFYFTGSTTIQARILTILPLEILGVIGLATILSIMHGWYKRLSIVVLVFLIFMNYTLRSLAGMLII